MISVQTDIPLPAKKASIAPLPLGALQVGDSFMIEGESYKSKIVAYVRAYGYKHGMTYACHNVEGGVRIWRKS